MNEFLAKYVCDDCGERVYTPHFTSEKRACINCGTPELLYVELVSVSYEGGVRK